MLIRRRSLKPLIAMQAVMGLAALLVASTAVAQDGTGQPSSQSKPSSNGAASTECTGRLKEFVSELDQLFDEDPPSLEPFLTLLRKYFPFKGCDVPEALRISRESKHLTGIYESRDTYVAVFESGKGSGNGFYVQFSLLKNSGDSRLPFAKVNM